MEKWARQFHSGSPVVETGKLLMTLCYAIHEGFTYKRRSEHGTQPPIVTLRSKHGTCRDFALLMMEAVRALGFAARFVTGYIYVASRDGKPTWVVVQRMPGARSICPAPDGLSSIRRTALSAAGT